MVCRADGCARATPCGWTVAGPSAAKQGTNGLAIASMVLGILWIYWIGSILALIFGYSAKREIRLNSGETLGGGGMATAGIVLGWIGVALLALFIVFVIIGFSTEADSEFGLGAVTTLAVAD